MKPTHMSWDLVWDLNVPPPTSGSINPGLCVEMILWHACLINEGRGDQILTGLQSFGAFVLYYCKIKVIVTVRSFFSYLLTSSSMGRPKRVRCLSLHLLRVNFPQSCFLSPTSGLLWHLWYSCRTAHLSLYSDIELQINAGPTEGSLSLPVNAEEAVAGVGGQWATYSWRWGGRNQKRKSSFCSWVLSLLLK